MKIRISGFILVFVLLTAVTSAWATTYYIAANGSDSNNGTSKTTPWLHLPGMNGCTAACASVTPQPGDRFIFKGGDTWGNDDFPINWAWSGTSQDPIYIGVDQTWFISSPWSRPIFDAQGTPMSGRNIFIYAPLTSNQTWDNIEVKNFSWNGPCPYGSCGVGNWAASSGGITIDHFFIHVWTYTGASTSTATSCSGTCDDFIAFTGDTNPPYLGNSIIQNSVIYNGFSSDSGQFAHAWPNAKNNYIWNVTNAILPAGHGEIAYNLITNIGQSFDNSKHENAIETLIADGAFYIHDNVIYNNYGESMMIGNPGETDYVWNNVMYNESNANPIHFPRNSQPAVAMYFWNNTIVPRAGVPCFIGNASGPSATTIVIQNNHCISDYSSLTMDVNASSLTIDHNYLETTAWAASEGLSSSQAFAYSPINPTVNTGVNLTSQATGPLSGLIYDTTYGCSNTFSNQVLFPIRATTTRPSTAAWQVGAYMCLGTPPIAYYIRYPASGNAPLSVTFDASASYSLVGSISSYAWDFGDGSTGTGVITTHVYPNVGTYTSTLTVTDNIGIKAIKSWDTVVFQLSPAMFTIATTAAAPGTDVDIPVTFTPSPDKGGTTLGFDMVLPSYFSFVSVVAGQAALDAGKDVASNLAIGRVIVWGMNVNIIGPGTIVIFKVHIDPSTPSGAYPITMTGAGISASGGTIEIPVLTNNGSVSVNSAGVLYGDVSGNGAVSAYDASLAAQYAVGLITLTQTQITKAEVSGNGAVSAYDASLIAQRAVGLIPKFPVEG